MWCECSNLKLSWVVTVWPKGQVVIPKEARYYANISPWDSLAVVVKDNKYIWFVKNEDMWELMDYIQNEKD